MVIFRLLGNVEVEHDGRPVNVGHARQRDVLAVLLLEVNRAVPIDALVDRVWGAKLPRHPRDSLYSYISRLRAVLGDFVSIRKQGGGYLLEGDPMTVDVHRFHDLVSRARGSTDDDTALALFDEAIGLWRGRPFAGLESLWLRTTGDQLEQQRLAAELDRNDLRLRTGQHTAVIAELPAAPLDERLAAQRIVALYRDARPAEALRQYEQVRARLADELGVDPGPQLRQLHQQILTTDPALDSAVRAVPRQLPASPPSFTGRAAELAELDASLEPGTIGAITGGGGTGKTWLALKWAHENLDQFPDGQLYVHLRGFDPVGEPVPPATAVRGLLEALGVAGAAIPADLDAQTAVYRSLIAGKRMLIVIDDARDTAALTPLLPGSRTCTVLVTSRNQLTGLVSAHGARPLALRLLDGPEARDLLVQRLGQSRVDTEPEAVAEIQRRCAGLPLALSIVAARVATQPELPLAVFAAELSEGLDALDTGELPASLRAVFAASYRALDAESARAFRLLGLAPGPDISLPAAVALVGRTDTQALLRRLTAANLVQQHESGRYRMHDLPRLYAAELARSGDVRADLTRLFNYYLHAASAAMDRFYPNEAYRRPVVTEPVTPAPGFATGEDAAEWLDTERPVLLAVGAHTAGHGWPDHASRLSATLFRYLEVRALYQDALTSFTNALVVTPADQPAHGHALYWRARILDRLGFYTEAFDHHTRALRIAQAHRDEVLECYVEIGFAVLAGRHGKNSESLDHYSRALAIARRSGDRFAEGIVLNNLGDFYLQIGRHNEAADQLRLGFAIALETEDFGLGITLLANLGCVHSALERHSLAISYLNKALAGAQRTRNRNLEVGVLVDLGNAVLAAGDPGQALDHFRAALTIAYEIGWPIVRARAHHGLAQAKHALNHTTGIREHLDEALSIYTALNAQEAGEIRQLLESVP